MTKFSIQTSKNKELFDVTDTIISILKHKLVEDGVVHLLVQNTNCAITILDNTELDSSNFFDNCDLIMGNKIETGAVLIGKSLSIPFVDSELGIGKNQRVVLVDLDGPGDRKIMISVTEDKV